MQIFSLRSHFSGSKGFTLIELVVVVSIMLILTTVLLFSQKRFDSSTVLRALAYGVALSVRQAQTYGTSVKAFTGGTTCPSGFCAQSYGVYFNKTTPNTYILFADLNNNQQYDAANHEAVQTFSLGQRYSISQFCATLSSGGSLVCSPSLTWLVVYFKRPNPDALFTSSASSVEGTYSDGYVVVQNQSGDTRRINMYTTGQIAVGGLNQ